MGYTIRNSALIAVLVSFASVTGCAATTPAFIPHAVQSLYGPTASDMPSDVGANQEHCSAIFAEIENLTTRLNLPNVDEDKGIFKPAQFNRGEIRRAYLMGLARGIPCPLKPIEATMLAPTETSGSQS